MTEILSKISSSVGFSKIINNFVIQKEKEKLTIFPLVMVNDTEKNENEDNGTEDHGNDKNGSGDHEGSLDDEEYETGNGADRYAGSKKQKKGFLTIKKAHSIFNYDIRKSRNIGQFWLWMKV